MAGIFAEMNVNRYPLLFVAFMVFKTYAIKYYVRHDSLFLIILVVDNRGCHTVIHSQSVLF